MSDEAKYADHPGLGFTDDYPKPGSVWRDRMGLERMVLGFRGNGDVAWQRPSGGRVFLKWLPYWREWARTATRVDETEEDAKR